MRSTSSPSLDTSVLPCYGNDCLPKYVCHPFPVVSSDSNFTQGPSGHFCLCTLSIFFIPPFSKLSSLPFSLIYHSLDGIRTHLTISFSIYRSIISNKDAGSQVLSDSDVLVGTAGERAPRTPMRGTSSSKAARAVLTETVQVTLSSSWTNDTFKSTLCASMDATTTRVTVSPGTAILPFLIPDCFFNYGTVTFVSMSNVLLQGNATFPDPLDRLATAMKPSAASWIAFSNSYFQPYNTWSATYTVPWTQFFATYPIITTLTMQNCSLSGSIMPRLPKTLTSLYLSQNSLTGSIPATMFENYAGTTSTIITYSFASNQLSGTIPSGLLTSIPAGANFYLYINSNNLTGTIPSDLFAFTKASTVTGVAINFGFNSLTGSLPANLWGFPTATTNSLARLSLTFTSNTGLSGTIPSKWLSQYSFPAMTDMTFLISGCGLSGNLHSGLVPASAPLLANYALTLTNNPMTGSITSGILPAVLALPLNATVTSKFTFTLTSARLTGALVLPSPPTSSTNFPRIALYLTLNSLTAFSAEVNTSKYLTYLDVSSNRALRGYVDNLFSSTSSLMTYLNLGNTMISGTLPDMSQMKTSALVSITMTSTLVEFCGNPNATAWAPTALTSCVLSNTTAYYCSSLYPAVCSLSDPTPFSPAPPFALPPIDAEPIDPPVPVANTPTPVGCPGTQPSDEFECINGVWTSTGTVTAPTIVISPGTSEVIVNGNVTSGTVVLQGTGSSITVTGCFTNLSVVTIQLTPEDLKKLGSHSVIKLLRSSGNCSDYSTVAVGTTVSGSSCRTVKVDKATTSSGSLNGVFSVSSSGCNLWWIILVSVLAGLTIIGVVVLLVVLRCLKSRTTKSQRSALQS